MFSIQQVTNDPKQKQVLLLDDGTSLSLTIRFVPLQLGWFIDNLTYTATGFELNGMRVTNQPNMLRQFKNQIPFGLACFSRSDREPSQQNDFSSGASKLYILSAAEVQAYEDFLSGK